MKFKNYCIVALGGVDGIKDIVSKITETKLRCLQQTGVFIGTFTCTMTATELKEVFDRESRTFFIFEVGNNTSAFKMGKEDIHNQLFGFIENDNSEVLNIMSDKLMNEINSIKMSGNTNEQLGQELSLQEQLNLAVDTEDYLKAAELRDLIKLNSKD